MLGPASSGASTIRRVRTNLTGGAGPFALIDSDYAGSKAVDAVLRSPSMDFSGETAVTLEFKYDFRWYSYGENEIADVDVSTNGGTIWTNVWRRSGANDRGPKTARVDISALAAGRPDVRVRFHYYQANTSGGGRWMTCSSVWRRALRRRVA